MLKMLCGVIIFNAIIIVTGYEKTYTKVSYTESQNTCMTDCIDNICMTFNKKMEECRPGIEPGLQYFTARIRTRNLLCKSRCGKFHYIGDDWCYVTDYEWDFCNPARGTYINVNKSFTYTKGLCKDKCDYRGSSYLWCNTYQGSWDECSSERFTYIQTKTRKGLECIGICGTHHNRKYSWCYTQDGEAETGTCAPPARNYSLLNTMVSHVSELVKKDSCQIHKDTQHDKRVRNQNDFEVSAFVSGYAESLERDNIGLFTENVVEVGNPITSYTVMPYALQGEPTLPLVVRAKVTNRTLNHHSSHHKIIFPFRVKENLQQMGAKVDKKDYSNDKDGHIIGYELGGPLTKYNFVPQTQGLEHTTNVLRNPSLWYDTENLIRDFVVNNNGWAEITVVVIYSDLPRSWMPQGYAVNFALYDNNNILYSECTDHYYSNQVDYY